MKISPLVAASAVLMVGVMALCATAVARRRDARARPPRAAPESASAPRVAPRYVYRPPAPPPTAMPAPPEPETAALRLRVLGPHGLLLAHATAVLTRVGADEDRDDDDEDATYELDADDAEPSLLSATDLPPGRYDLAVRAPGMRTTRVEGVPTGDEIVTISLARAPVLLGALGRALSASSRRAGPRASARRACSPGRTATRR